MSENKYYIQVNYLISSYIGNRRDWIDWLNENIGRQNWQYHGPGSSHPYSLCFQSKEDALAFVLKFDIKLYL
jgi:hypothetical protein